MTDTNPTPDATEQTPVEVTPTDLGAPVEPTTDASTTGEHVATNAAPTVVEPIWFPSQRVLRTIFQVVLAVGAALGVLVVVAPQILDAISTVLPGPWVAWLTGAIAFLAGISAAFSRVMAIPAVDAFLVKVGLGSTTKGAAHRAAQSASISS